MMDTTAIFDADEVRRAALLEELQTQRSFFGDRAVNLAAELAIKNAELNQALARIKALEKEREEWKTKNPELPLEI